MEDIRANVSVNSISNLPLPSPWATAGHLLMSGLWVGYLISGFEAVE